MPEDDALEMSYESSAPEDNTMSEQPTIPVVYDNDKDIVIVAPPTPEPQASPKSNKAKATGNINRRAPRSGKLQMGTQAYYRAEKKAFEAKRDKKLEEIERTISGPRVGKAEAIKKANDQFAQDMEGAQKRLNMKKGGKTTAEKRNELLSDALTEEEKRMLSTQSDQNYIIGNMLKFTQFLGQPDAMELDKLIMLHDYKGNLVNKLTVNRKLAPLMEATPLELSSLVPRFRLFHMPEGRGGALDEFLFSDRYSWEYRNAEGQILNHRSSRGGGIGLKSFQWDTTGQDPFTAPRMMTAKLVIHFQSITDLASQARGTHPGPTWYDLIMPRRNRTSVPKACAEELPEIDNFLRDEFSSAQLKKIQKDERAYEVATGNFSLVAEVGYASAKKSVLSKPLAEAIDAARMILNLSLTNYTFRFREEGTIDLEITYVASMEAALSSYDSNLFSLTEDGAQSELVKLLEQKKKEFGQLKSDISSPTGAVECMKKNATRNQATAITAKAEQFQAEVKKLEEEIEVLTRDYKLSMYGKFTQFLINQQRLFFMDVPERDYAYGTFPTSRVAIEEVDREGIRGAGSSETSVSDLAAGDQAAMNDLVKKNSTANKEGEEQVAAASFSGGISAQFDACHPLAPGQKRVYFFYLGDLVNFYAGVLPDEDGRSVQRHEIILGDLSFLDYQSIGARRNPQGPTDYRRTTAESGDQNFGAGSTISDEQMQEQITSPSSAYRVKKNLAYVPISLDGYNQWFIDKITNGNTIFTFKQFMNSLVSELLVGALQSVENNYIGEGLRNMLKERDVVRNSVIFGRNMHLQRGVVQREEILPNNQSSYLINMGLPPIANKTMWDDSTTYSTIKNDDLRSFLVISVSRLPYQDQIIDEEANAHEGIFHLKIGTNKGILKTMDMQRDGSSAIQDMNIMRAYNSMTDPGLGVIQQPYQASCKTFGAGWFQPGQYIYLNPVNMGLGDFHSRFSLSRDLGIGGFYMITQCSHMLTDGQLETTIKCKFQYYGVLPNTEEQAGLPNEPVTEIQTARGKTKRERNAQIAQDALNELGIGGGTDESTALTEALASANTDQLSAPTLEEGNAGTRDTGAYGTQQNVIGTGQLGSGNAMGTQGQTGDLPGQEYKPGAGEAGPGTHKDGSLSLGSSDGRQGEEE